MNRLIPGRDPVLSESGQLMAFARTLAAALDRRCEPVVPVAPPVPARRASRGLRPADDAVPPPPVGFPAPPGETDEPVGDQTGPVTDAVQMLWREYLRSRDVRARDALIVHYCTLVRSIAHRMISTLPSHVDLADLAQSGVFGLVEAVERFDPERSPRFESYAAQRIRGAMLDELRAQDWVPRTVRGRARELERAQERLEARLGRVATDREIADELGVPVREMRGGAHPVQLVSVEALDEGHDGRGGIAEMLVDDTAVDPQAVVQRRETSRHLSLAVGQLGERDRLVIRLYYLENRTLAEIGRVLGVTESRVCQLHSRLVGRLRTRLDELAAG